MSEHNTHLMAVSVDVQWLEDWVAEGIATFEAFLAKQAAFAAFLAAREALHSNDGDGAAER